jgi:hypothetical protein
VVVKYTNESANSRAVYLLYTFDCPYTDRNILTKDDLTSFHWTSQSRITIWKHRFSGLLGFGAHSQNCEKRLLASSYMSIRLSVRLSVRTEELDSQWAGFHTLDIWVFFACWITKARDTHPECLIITAFPLHQWLQERASRLRYTYIACLVYRTSLSNFLQK